MKILLIVPGGVDQSGEKRVVPAILNLIEGLAKRHDLLVITLEQYPQPCSYELLGAKVVNLGQQTRLRFSGAIMLNRLWRILKVLQDWGKPDLIHAIWANRVGLSACLLGQLIQRPSLISFWGGELVSLPEINYGAQRHWRGKLNLQVILKLAAQLSIASQASRKQLQQKSSREALYIPLGPKKALFYRHVARPLTEPIRLLHIGSINLVKDQKTLLQALSLLQKQGLSFHLDWVGEDTLDGALQALVTELGLSKQVYFHDFLPTSQVAALCHQAHLYVHSALHESQCVAVCEAALAGVPTVGTAVGLIAELAPEAAIAVPVGDIKALAEGIKSLIQNPSRREKMGAAAQTWALAHDADWTTAQFEACYQKLVKKNHKAI